MNDPPVGRDEREPPWQPRTVENRLIHAYHQAVGGRLWLEVGVVRPRGPHAWPPGSRLRFIDGVVVLDTRGPTTRWSVAAAGQFHDEVRGHEVHLLEAKESLGRYVIGQSIVAVDLFTLDYPNHGELDTLCVVARADPTMRWAAEQHGVGVWMPEPAWPAPPIRRRRPS
jgi:hypothetical protein